MLVFEIIVFYLLQTCRKATVENKRGNNRKDALERYTKLSDQTKFWSLTFQSAVPQTSLYPEPEGHFGPSEQLIHSNFTSHITHAFLKKYQKLKKKNIQKRFTVTLR